MWHAVALISAWTVQLRELELKLKQYGNSEMTTNPQDFISRKDHARLIDARINGREADLQVCLATDISLHFQRQQVLLELLCAPLQHSNPSIHPMLTIRCMR